MKTLEELKEEVNQEKLEELRKFEKEAEAIIKQIIKFGPRVIHKSHHISDEVINLLKDFGVKIEIKTLASREPIKKSFLRREENYDEPVSTQTILSL